MTWLGLDPGRDGAIALLSDALFVPDGWVDLGGLRARVAPLATTKLKSKTVTDGLALAQWLTAEIPPGGCYGVIEHQHARQIVMNGGRRVDTPSSSFGLGYAYGVVQGVLCGAQISHEQIEPAEWKRALNLGAAKEDAIAKAQDLFPAVALTKPRGQKPHDGLAEALLLAEYARRRWSGEHRKFHEE